ncbi:MAG: hypothetical protein NT062_26795, partial [Proteobacteria bacterium]|nr:hypothetical protein [Pseudomonadota bacterium]
GGSSSGGGASGSAGGGGGVLDKLKRAGDKVGGALDTLDADEATEKLAAAKASLAAARPFDEECAWVARVADDAAKDATKAPIAELRRLCSFEAPLARATAAVARAEAAKAEQPEAPSLTECSSDDWAKASQQLDASAFASEARWIGAKARWTKVCGNQ